MKNTALQNGLLWKKGSPNSVGIAIQGIHSAADIDCILYGECLARVETNSTKLLSTQALISALESCGTISLFDQLILELVLEELSADPHAVLGCNISADTLNDVTRWKPICDMLQGHRCLLDRLVLEITETRPIQNIELVNDALKTIRKSGCRVAVDDFGNGHLTPLQLLQLEVDIVKIDAAFVGTIKGSLPGKNSLQAIVGFAKCVVQTVVVEGIENEAHLAEARRAGATHIQGFYLSRPISP